MHRICKTVAFEAAHQLTRFPTDHKCSRLHGHNYRVEVQLASETLSEEDFTVLDFGVVSAIVKKYDHQNLNEFPEFKDNPTAELLCTVITDLISRYLFQTGQGQDVKIERVRVYETDDCWAEWSAS